MSLQLIQERIQGYQPQTKQEELNALKEIMQEIVLAALTRTDFFKEAAFQGGTCLRIVYGMSRFSEDLDFVLQKSNMNFIWQPFLQNIQEECVHYGIEFMAQDRSKVGGAVKKAFLKQDSIGQVLTFTHLRNKADPQTLMIKLEIDTHPPEGSKFERKFIDFPYPCAMTVQDLPSLFAGKCHALLCRSYVKGRDWFDFIWYVTRGTDMNLVLLSHALQQTGRWQNEVLSITKAWVIEALTHKIQIVDWSLAQKDVQNFLKGPERQALTLWGVDLFMFYIEQLKKHWAIE
jgi:predicted nucleotidyltransferase component of viral defense system